MNDFPSPAPRPEPQYYQFRVPRPGRGVVLATVAGVAILGVAAYAAYQGHASDVRLTEARQAFAPTADEILQRSRAGLGQAEGDLQALGQAIDQGMAAKNSKAIDVNSFASAQGGLADRLQRIGGELSSLDAKQAAAVASERLKPGTVLLSDAEQKDLGGLRDRTAADAAAVTGLDPKIAALAQRRETLAQAEAAANAKIAARREKELADARAMQSESTGPDGSRVISEDQSAPPVEASAPVYYAGPAYDPYYYPYGYGYYGPSIIIGGGWGWGHGWGHGHGRR